MTPVTVTVCLCTFRRPSVHDTLASLATQDLPEGVTLRVVVADNDETPAALDAILASASRLGLALSYVHAPARNISIARNAALDHAAPGLVAILDDDETADRGWLRALLEEHERSGADVVLGPVVPVYADDAPAWMRDGEFHAIRPVYVGGRIVTGYTSNVLLDPSAPALAGQRFRLDLGRTGGEDTEFFERATRRGAVISHAPDAIVREPVEAGRATVRWLLARRFRAGQSHAVVLTREPAGPVATLGAAGLAAAKCSVCAACALATVVSPRRAAFWSLRATLHAGVVARLLGIAARPAYGLDRPDGAR